MTSLYQKNEEGDIIIDNKLLEDINNTLPNAVRFQNSVNKNRQIRPSVTWPNTPKAYPTKRGGGGGKYAGVKTPIRRSSWELAFMNMCDSLSA